MPRLARESEYRYYGAVQRDTEPLPSSVRPNRHPLRGKVRKEMFSLSKKLRKLEHQIRSLVRQDRVVPKRLQGAHDEILAQLKSLSQTGIDDANRT